MNKCAKRITESAPDPPTSLQADTFVPTDGQLISLSMDMRPAVCRS